jgi:hypothetical protein
MGDPGPWRDSYDVAALQGVAGFYIQEPEDDSYGAFCLWECENSPLIEDLTARWNNRPSDEGRTLLRHFETSCDELGLFQFVAGDVVGAAEPAYGGRLFPGSDTVLPCRIDRLWASW